MFMLEQKLSTKVWGKAEKAIFNTYKFFNHDNNKFVLLSGKGVYPYEYMDEREKFIQMWLPSK